MEKKVYDSYVRILETEQTLQAIGYVGKTGMKQTDVEILNLMIGTTRLD